jgi:hypothetical protein
MVFYLILEETVLADNLAKDEFNCRNIRYSGLRPSPVAVSAAENDMMMRVVVIDKCCKAVRVWRCRRSEF